MQGPLSPREKEHLLEVVGALYGSKRQFEAYTSGFNERTVEVVEELLAELKRCNANMQKLLIGVAGAGALASRGWLRKILKELSEQLQKEHVALIGAACRNVVRVNGITPIISTAF